MPFVLYRSLRCALTFLFVCARQLLLEHSGRPPSLRVAVAVVCALRALRLPQRTARVAHYARIQDLQVPPGPGPPWPVPPLLSPTFRG